MACLAPGRALKILLPQYCGSDSVAIHAVYPCRDFMPEKVNVFIEFLSEIYGPEPYWNQRLDLERLLKPCIAASGAPAKKENAPVASRRPKRNAPPIRQPDGRP